MPPDRLTWIDDTNRAEHPYLDPGDRCLYFREYFARKGYQGGPTNQLVFNFKIKPSDIAANPARARYKNEAVRTFAADLRNLIARASVDNSTWVPIPPSKAIGDPDYDDRLIRTLSLAYQGYGADIRPMLQQTVSTKANHTADDRLTPDALKMILSLDLDLLNSAPLKKRIVLVDDVLTTGNHFKCCQRRLREVVPDTVEIIGIFVARRVPASPFE